jgi:hypothetical protein
MIVCKCGEIPIPISNKKLNDTRINESEGSKLYLNDSFNCQNIQIVFFLNSLPFLNQEQKKHGLPSEPIPKHRFIAFTRLLSSSFECVGWVEVNAVPNLNFD